MALVPQMPQTGSCWLILILAYCFAAAATPGPQQQASEGEVRSLAVAITTCVREKFRRRVAMARATWAGAGAWGGEPQVAFVSDVADPSLGVHQVCDDQPLPAGWPSTDFNHARHMKCCKTVSAIGKALSFFPEVTWVAHGSDDTFFFPRSLAAALEVFNPMKLVYTGCPGITTNCDTFAACGLLHAGGSGGIILSRPLAELLVKRRADYLHGCWHEDVHLGLFLDQLLGIPLHPLPGTFNVPRFSALAGVRFAPGAGVAKLVGAVLAIRTCPEAVLPRPVIADVFAGGWGQPRGVEPNGLHLLATMHSEPEMWPEMQRLWEEAHQAGVLSQILYYLDTEEFPDPEGQGYLGHMYGRIYEGHNVLSVCALRPGSREASYRQLTAGLPYAHTLRKPWAGAGTAPHRWVPLKRILNLPPTSNYTIFG